MASKQQVKEALIELGFETIPDSILSDTLELVYRAGIEAGKLEAAERQARTLRDCQRLYQRSVLVAQVRRLLVINRYLYSLLIDKEGRSCSFEKAVDLFTHLPGPQKSGRPKKPIPTSDGKAIRQIKRLHRQTRRRAATDEDPGQVQRRATEPD